MINRRIAKGVYQTGGLLSRVRTPQQTWSIPNMEQVFSEGADPKVVKAEKVWLPCNLSLKLTLWSERLDPVHWAHWALEHKGCGASYCMDCKGYSCGEDGHN